MAQSLTRTAKVTRDLLRHRFGSRYESTISAEVSRLVGRGIGSSALPLLGMGRDVADGRIVLRDGEIDVAWTSATSAEYFASMRETMREISSVLLADFHDSPLWWRTKHNVTVHPWWRPHGPPRP